MLLSLLEPFEGQPLVVAVSGGGDSMALLHMLAEWDGAPLHVLFVDHGLRDIAAEEQLVAEACARLDVPLQVSRWQWDGQGNLQARARDARRAALLAHAVRVGAPAVVLGHTSDDQAETVLLNLARGSGVDGLAGIAPQRLADGVTWLRPLLETAREDLRAWLRARGLGWADDPSNDNPAFDRVRARQMMAQLEGLGLTKARLAQTADHMRAARATLHTAAASCAERCTQDRGDVLLPLDVLSLASDTDRRVLAAGIAWVSGGLYKPRWSQLSALKEMPRRTTMSGVLLAREATALRLTREHQAVAQLSTPLAGGVWDRWRLTGPLAEAQIAALGEAGLMQIPDWRSANLPRLSLLATPGVWQNGTLLGAPLANFGPWTGKIETDFTSFVLSH